MFRSASHQFRQVIPTSTSFCWFVACLAGVALLGCNPSDSNQPVTSNSDTRTAKTVSLPDAVEPSDLSDKASQAAIDEGAIDEGAIDEGAIDEGAIDEGPIDKKPIDDGPAINDPAFHQAITAAIDSYLQYPMVNSIALVAPTDCRAPSDDARPRMSKSDHESTHGQKLYYLFVKDITHYLSQDGSPSPEGQILVKESWTAKTSNPDARNLRNHASGVRINPRVTVGQETIEIGKRKDLFVMVKLPPETANTDEGWVYGVVDPNSLEVTASGKVASCMRCHEEATHDRLFGPALGN